MTTLNHLTIAAMFYAEQARRAVRMAEQAQSGTLAQCVDGRTLTGQHLDVPQVRIVTDLAVENARGMNACAIVLLAAMEAMLPSQGCGMDGRPLN